MNANLARLLAIVLLIQLGSVAIADTAADAAAAAAAAAKTVYATPETLVFEILNLKDEEIIRVVLALQPDVKAIEPQLMDVAFGERHDNSLMAFFNVRMETPAADSKVPPALLITVKPKSLQSGSYKLRIDLRKTTPPPVTTTTTPSKGSKSPAGKPTPEPPAMIPQPITIEIKLPAAKVNQIAKLVIHQVRYCIICNDPPVLALSEVSGKGVRLTNVKIEKTYPNAADNQASSQTVSFVTVPEIAPNATGKSAVTLSGDFPLGSSAGAVLVSAPQLTEPSWIPFEVKSRLSDWIIVLVIVLGLILGFVVRIWSKRRVELREARLKGLAAAAALRAELKRPDTVFRERVQPSLSALELAVENGSIETVNKSIGLANTALTEALSDLNVRRTHAKNQFEALIRLTKKAAALPPSIAVAMKIDTAALEAGRIALEQDDVTQAQKTFAPLVEGLSGKLAAATGVWRADVKLLLDQMAGLLIFLPEKTSASIDGDTLVVNTKLDALVFSTNDPSLEDVATFVRSVSDATDSVKALVLRTGSQLANSVNSLKAGYDALPKQPAPGAVNQVFESVSELLKRLPGWLENPKEGATELSQSLGTLKMSWREALIAQIKGMDVALKSLHESFAADRYFTAAFNVITYLRENPPAQSDTVLGDDAQPASEGSMLLSEGLVSFFNLFGKRPEDDVTPTTNVQERSLPPNLEALRARTWWELATTKALRFAIASLIILAIGYALFVDTFVGTFNELLAIFVWAFGTNISVDTIMDSTKKVDL